MVPRPCAGLSAALPAVLQRSTHEAALLVARLPAADRARLRTVLLSLHRRAKRLRLHVAPPLVWHIVADGVAGGVAGGPQSRQHSLAGRAFSSLPAVGAAGGGRPGWGSWQVPAQLLIEWKSAR